MKWRETAWGYIIRFELEEEVVSNLSQLARQMEIKGGVFYGIGAVKAAVIGYFEPSTQQYQKKNFPESMELVSLEGTLSWLEGEPFIHAHAVLAGSDFSTYGGHLFSAKVSATVELWVHTLRKELKRFYEPHQKMNLLEV